MSYTPHALYNSNIYSSSEYPFFNSKSYYKAGYRRRLGFFSTPLLSLFPGNLTLGVDGKEDAAR